MTSTPFDSAQIASQLTLEEACSLLHGKDFWRLNGVPRLNVPSGLKVSDGPNGARGQDFVGGVPAACFPAGSCLGATFDPASAVMVGKALASECRSKSAWALLGPTVNVHRSPLGGRNFESYSEDPVLSGLMASGYINGLQGEGITAVIKHFICNDSETDRRSLDVKVDEKTLREIYLRPFQIAFAEAGPHGMMTSYNKVNGTYVGEQKRLLDGIVRTEWNVKDLMIVSDWWAVYSVEAPVLAGLDLEMPDSFMRGGGRLLQAARKNDELAAAVYKRAANVLALIQRAGGCDLPLETPEVVDDQPSTRALIRQVGADGAVLLKNSAVLPLSTTQPLSVTGFFATTALAHGGGSASLNAHHRVTPLSGLQERFDHVSNTPGVAAHCQVPLLDETVMSSCLVDFCNPDGTLVESRSLGTAYLTGLDRYPKALVSGWTAKMHFTLKPLVTSPHVLSLASPSVTSLSLDGQYLCETAANPSNASDFIHCASHRLAVDVTVDLEAGKEYRVVIDYKSTDDVLFASACSMNGIKFGILALEDEDKVIQNAVEDAERTGVAVVVVGHGSDYESEGFDRTTLSLLGRQNDLISALAASSAKVVVAISTGSAIAMPWLDQVDAVIQCGFAGQEIGHALADVLSGTVCPSGRLPYTMPLLLEDNSSHGNFPGDNEQVEYAEGVYVGYRHYVSKGVPVLFPFGSGLSYTSFDVQELQLDGQASVAPGRKLKVSFKVANTGKVDGRHTVLVFVQPPQSSTRPTLALEGFAKSSVLTPGETQTLEVSVGAEAFSVWKGQEDGCWQVVPGTYEIQIRHDAASAPIQSVGIVVAEGWEWSGLKA